VADKTPPKIERPIRSRYPREEKKPASNTSDRFKTFENKQVN
jgi:hypothetical protein